MVHSYAQKERLEARKRGKKSEQTSDAKFDERFKFAYGLQDSKVSSNGGLCDVISTTFFETKNHLAAR